MIHAETPERRMLFLWAGITIPIWIASVLLWISGRPEFLIVPATFSLLWMWFAYLYASALMRAEARRDDRNRKLEIAALEGMLYAVNDFAVQSMSSDPPERKDWLIQNARKNLARRFFHVAIELGLTKEEFARLLERPTFKADPLLLRDVVGEMTSAAAWPQSDPEWKVDLLTFVLRDSSCSAAEVARFQESLRKFYR